MEKANLDEYSVTMRMMFQIFSLGEDLFLENYINYMKNFIHFSKVNAPPKDKQSMIDLKNIQMAKLKSQMEKKSENAGSKQTIHSRTGS